MSSRRPGDDRPLSDSQKWRRLQKEDTTSESSTSESPSPVSAQSESSSGPPTPIPPSGPLSPILLAGPAFPEPPDEPPPPSPPYSDSADDSDYSSNDSFVLVPDDEIEGAPIPNTVQAIKEFLRRWAIDHGCTLRSLTSLCHGLKELHPECLSQLPVDARTILGTPVGILPLQDVPPGKYVHIGLHFQLQQVVSMVPTVEDGDQVSMVFNIDGMPLMKSSHSQFYVITVYFPCIIPLRGRAFPVGVYHGQKKPESFITLLQPFVDELKELMENGFDYEGRRIRIVVLAFSCDTPAKSDILGIVHHTGYWSCTRCVAKGETFGGTRVFLTLTERLRTDAEFRSRADPRFRPPGRSTALMEIPNLDMTRAFVLHPMHLFYLGVMKTQLEVWTSSGVRRHQLSDVSLTAISESLLQSRTYLPCELKRRPRELNSVLKWKATEFSTFAHYLGPVVMKDHLPAEKCNHFIAFYIAVTILMCSKHCTEERKRSYARALLVWFADNTKKTYSPSLLTSNYHNLIHVTDDADHFSKLIPFFSMYVVSAFPSEDLLGILKRLIKGPNRPLQQGIRRVMELCLAHMKFDSPVVNSELTFSDLHRDGPLLALCKNPQYKTVNYPNYKLTVSKEADCYCKLDNGAVVKIENIACDNDDTKIIIGKQLTDAENFYPSDFCDERGSLELGIVKGRHFSQRRQWALDRIRAKVFAVPRPGRDDFVFFPMLHTYQ